jgi:hypothetical protein
MHNKLIRIFHAIAIMTCLVLIIIGGFLLPAAYGFVRNFLWKSVSIPVTGTYVDCSNTDALPVFAAVIDDGSTSTGVGCWKFPPSKEASFYTSFEIPTDWIATTPIYPSLHWSPITDGTTDYVVIGIEYTAANVNGTFSSTTLNSRTVSASGALKHYKTDIPTTGIQPTSAAMYEHIMIRGFRDGSDTDNDGYTDYICIHGISFDYQTDEKGLGARKRTTR